MSTSSLSSSFSSSASSSMLHHAASPSNSSRSDLATSDHSAVSSLSTPTKSHFPSVAVSPAPRSSSLGVMGQTYTRPQPAVSSSSPHSSAVSAPMGASKGFKLRNAFGARRKQSEDANVNPLSLSRTGSKGQGPKTDDAPVKSPETDKASGRRPLRAKQLTLQLASAFGTKQSSPTSPGLPPPTPPPKSTAKTYKHPGAPAADYGGPILVSSPTSSQHVQYDEPPTENEVLIPKHGGADKSDQDKVQTKEVWRKSNSDSFSTIRPGASNVGNRASRPVSMAESLQSTHTIVPVNKRLSSLVTDVEFAMAEEGGQDVMILPASLSGKTSPSGSVKSRNRRSVSLNLPSPFPRAKTPSLASASAASEEPKSLYRPHVESPAMSPSLSTTETPTLTTAAASGYILPMASRPAAQSTGNNIRGRLAAWSPITNNMSSQLQQDQRLPRIDLNGPTPLTMRQTAVSITSGFSAGLAKRAVEKMGRAWGGMQTGSGYSSSSSTNTAPSSFSNPSTEDLRCSNATQPSSKHLGIAGGKGKQRRTPNAPSGAWSVSSSTSSDSDAYSTSAGPILGKCMRGPTRSTGVGAVFGRDLRSCVAETALPASRSTQVEDAIGRPPYNENVSGSNAQRGQDNELEARRIPALVVRCAQHIFTWGLQEEGLFRLTGRPSHMSKLRAEFDTGADYDLSGCSPGDLDPHAVSSIFKAYLRELPEPILTHALMPYFDAVLSAESYSRQSQETPRVAHGMKGPSLPVHPRAPAIRKPPSLSTLAMPNFSGMRAPSESLVNALRSLIAGLPQENRDLLRTVTDLIKATASRSQETKMPLSNLLLVFCPSLSMNPPLLRVLCEAEGIWDVPHHSPGQPSIMNIKRESITMDISPDTPRQPEDPSVDSEEPDESISDMFDTDLDRPDSASDETKLEIPGAIVTQAMLDFAATQRRPERSGSPAYGSRPLPRPPLGTRREASTLYLDSESTDNLVSQSFPPSPSTEVLSSGAIPSESELLKDDSTCSRSSSVSPAPPNPRSPPSLSSSTDSLASSEMPSSSHLPLSQDPIYKSEISSLPRPPTIIKASDLSLPPSSQRSATSPTADGDVQFPSAGSLPTSPSKVRPPRLLTNISTPQLPGPTSTSSLRTRRIKKPSLHLLFTRRSSTSLHSASIDPASISGPTPYLQPPHSASPLSSASTPLSVQQSMYTAQTSTSSLPPVLDTTIEISPFQMDMMGVDDNGHRTIGDKPGSSHSNHTVIVGKDDEPPLPSFSVTPGPNETPIANLYSTPSSSVLSFRSTDNTEPLRLRPKPRRSQPSSTASFNHLSMALPDEAIADDDWAQSVLAAADTDGTWSAKGIMKFFGGS